MDLSKILTGLLSKAYKLEDGKIAELLKEDANENDVITSILEIDTQRVDKLKTAGDGGKFQEGYAKAKKEVLTDFEKSLKEQYDLKDSDKMGQDLIAEILTTKAPGEGKTGGEITDDDVKKHAAYQAMEKNFKKQLADAQEKATEKIAEVEKNFKRNETFYTVKENANVILESLKPILAKNPTVANTIKNQFFNELKGFDFERQEDGTFLVMKGGKVVEDKHGHSVGFDEIIKSIAGNYFEFQENNGGSNAGNQNAGGQGATITSFKSEKEALAYANDVNVPLADRMKALEDFNKAQAAE